MSNYPFPKNAIQNGIGPVPQSELDARLEKVNEELDKHGAKAMVFFSATNITYLTGSHLIATERPIAFVYVPGGEKAFFVPLLEREHAAATTEGYRIVTYDEYPGETHPMLLLKELLQDMGVAECTIAADADGYPPAYGYEGPALSEVLGHEVVVLSRMVQHMKEIKSEYEQSLIRESAKWSNLAMGLLRDYTKPGLTETDVCARAGHEASQMMLRALGSRFQVSSDVETPVITGYRGQIGPDSYFPHATTTNIPFRKGYVLGCYAQSTVSDYICELERNFFMGEPTDEQKKYYDLARQLNRVCIEAVKAGEPCSSVDRAARKFYKDNGIWDCWRHHVGHCLGTGMHEMPVLDIGCDRILQPGMCFSIEPGIYVEGVGGFRLSDTILVHEDCVEVVTFFDRDIEKLVIDC